MNNIVRRSSLIVIGLNIFNHKKIFLVIKKLFFKLYYNCILNLIIILLHLCIIYILLLTYHIYIIIMLINSEKCTYIILYTIGFINLYLSLLYLL